MSLSEDVDLEEFVMAKDDLSGADIKAVCTEAGLLALRERRMRVTKQDFTTAREKVCLFFCELVASASSHGFPLSGAVPKERGHSRGPLLVIIISWYILDRHSACNKTSFSLNFGCLQTILKP